MQTHRLYKAGFMAISLLTLSACVATINTDLSSLNSAVERNPEQSQPLNDLGIGFASYARYNEAYDSFTKAIALSPASASPYYNRGLASLNLKRYSRAVQDFDKAISLKGDYDKAYVERGNALAGLGKKSAAIESYQKAISLNRYNAIAYYQIGNIYQKSGDHNRAVEAYDKAMDFSSNVPQLFYARGISRYALQNYRGAKFDFTTAANLKPSFDMYIRLGRAADKLGEWNDAYFAYLNANRLKPSDVEARKGLKKSFAMFSKNS